MSDLVEMGQVWRAAEGVFVDGERPTHIILSNAMKIDYHPIINRSIPMDWYVIAFDVATQECWLATAHLYAWIKFGTSL